MVKTWSFQAKSPKHGQEDAFLITRDHVFLLSVADGVSRAIPRDDPSPAKQAADLFLKEMYDTLIHLRRTQTALHEACRIANYALQKLNQKLGLWDTQDRYHADFAATVAASFMIDERDQSAALAYLSDCGAMHLSAKGKVMITPDHIERIRDTYFPPKGSMNPVDRADITRRQLRNNPARGLNESYGVFTGEDAAMRYVRLDRWRYRPGDVLVLFTDGMRPFVENMSFQEMLRVQNTEAIQELIADMTAENPTKFDDDKTLVVAWM